MQLETDKNGTVIGQYRVVQPYPSDGNFRGVHFRGGKSVTLVTGQIVRWFASAGCKVERVDGQTTSTPAATAAPAAPVAASADRVAPQADVVAPLTEPDSAPVEAAEQATDGGDGLPDDVEALRVIFEQETGGAANKRWGVAKLRQFILEERAASSCAA